MNAKTAILLILVTPSVLSATPPGVVRVDTGLVISPFAVPVATPVAVLNPAGVLYRIAPNAGAYSQPNSSQPRSGDDRQLWSEFQQFRRWQQSRTSNSSLSPPSPPQTTRNIPQITTSCLKCHSGTNPKGNIPLDTNPPEQVRLQAIRAVITGTMPPESALTPQQRGQLLLELATPAGPDINSIPNSTPSILPETLGPPQ